MWGLLCFFPLFTALVIQHLELQCLVEAITSLTHSLHEYGVTILCFTLGYVFCYHEEGTTIDRLKNYLNQAGEVTQRVETHAWLDSLPI